MIYTITGIKKTLQGNLLFTYTHRNKICFLVLKTRIVKIWKNGLYSCGTVRGNRKGLPSILSDTKIKLNRGEFTFLVKSCVAAVKWQDNKAVSLLSTLHNPKDVVFIQRKQNDGSRIDISCPEVVRTYNNIMGGVDRFDQLRERYAIGRRSVKWWHRLFYFFIDLAVINSFQLAFKVKIKQNKKQKYAFFSYL